MSCGAKARRFISNSQNKTLKRSGTKPQPKTRPLHHGGTETRRKTKNKWVLFGPPDPDGFIQGRVSIFRSCLPSRKMRARKNKDRGLDFRAKIVASCEDLVFGGCNVGAGTFVTREITVTRTTNPPKTSAASATSAFQGFVFSGPHCS